MRARYSQRMTQRGAPLRQLLDDAKLAGTASTWMQRLVDFKRSI